MDFALVPVYPLLEEVKKTRIRAQHSGKLAFSLGKSYTYVNVYIHVCIYLYVYTCVCIYVHIYVYTYNELNPLFQVMMTDI